MWITATHEEVLQRVAETSWEFHSVQRVVITGYGYTWEYIHPFNGPLSRTTLVSQYQKGKLIWTVLNQETVASAGPYASLHLAITTPAPHHSVFTGRMPLLPPNQQCQSIEGIIHTTNDKPVNCYTPFAKFICWHYMDWKRNMALITMLVNSPVYL